MKKLIISGDAGTGKSYYLAGLMKEALDNNKSFIALAFTHSAVNNISSIFSKLYNIDINNKCKTFHSYFAISVDGKIGKKYHDKLNYIFIDEYSLIPIDLFDKVKDNINCDNLIICGDYKQLKPINIKPEISYVKLYDYINKYGPLNSAVIEAICHYENILISMPFFKDADKKILTEQKRNNNKVFNIIQGLVFGKNEVKCSYIMKSTLLSLMNQNYTFIASKYEYLFKIHSFINTRKKYDFRIKQKNNSFKEFYLSKGDKVIITENIKYGDEIITNGDEYVFEDYVNKSLVLSRDDNKIFIDMINDCYPILPANVITYHKAQGKSYDNVILCVDNLFDFTMLYTGLSRARNDILLFTFDDNKVEPSADKYKALEMIMNNFISNK